MKSKKILLWTHAGMGDMVYLYSIAKWMLARGFDVAVRTHVPEMFECLNIETIPFNAPTPEDKYYVLKGDYFACKSEKDTNQFEDICYMMGIKEEVPLCLEYDQAFVRYKMKVKKPVSLVKHPVYKMMGGYVELASKEERFQWIVDTFREYYHIQVGSIGDDLRLLKGIDLDLIGKTSIYDLLYLVDHAELVITRTGHMLSIAEAFNTPVICILSKKLRTSRNYVLNTITPEKIKCGKSSVVIWDDDNFFREKVTTFVEKHGAKRKQVVA